MPNSLESLFILFFVAPGFVASEAHAYLLPLKERTTFDKLVTAVIASLLIHFLMLPIWLACNDKWQFWDYAAAAQLGRDAQSIWLIWKLAITYLAPAMGIGYITGRWLIPIVMKPHLPVWSVEIFQEAKRTNKAMTAYVIMTNGDIYVGIVKSIPHDYETLHGDDKDFSLANASYLPKESRTVEQLENQVVLLNTSDVAAQNASHELWQVKATK